MRVATKTRAATGVWMRSLVGTHYSWCAFQLAWPGIACGTNATVADASPRSRDEAAAPPAQLQRGTDLDVAIEGKKL